MKQRKKEPLNKLAERNVPMNSKNKLAERNVPVNSKKKPIIIVVKHTISCLYTNILNVVKLIVSVNELCNGYRYICM